MKIGSGIALIVVGAILSFALRPDFVSFININLVGYILMAAGALLFLFSIGYMLSNRTSKVTARSSIDPATGDRVEQRESTTPPIIQ